MTSKGKATDAVTSSFKPVGPWMWATEAAAHPAWKALMDATSKLGMIGMHEAFGTVACSSMVYKWSGSRVRPLAGSINIDQDVGMASTLPAGSKVAYEGTDGSSMQVETRFVMGFPEFCPQK